MTTLEDLNELSRLFADPTRVRLMALLSDEELSVAELTEIMELAQSRVSTHLGRLREAQLVAPRRHGASAFYRAHAAMPPDARAMWDLLRAGLDDPRLASDRARCRDLVSAREKAWPDSVAGKMERHYSPGRTWEATARAFLGLARFGDVLDAGSGDGTLAALIAPRANSVTCLDRSETVLSAARDRLRGHDNVAFENGDLLELPFAAERFDQVMLFNVLTYTTHPERALSEAERVLRPGGRVTIVTLAAHEHQDITSAYGHVEPGFPPKALRRALRRAGLVVDACEVTSRERRKPHFEVISAFAHKRNES